MDFVAAVGVTVRGVTSDGKERLAGSVYPILSDPCGPHPIDSNHSDAGALMAQDLSVAESTRAHRFLGTPRKVYSYTMRTDPVDPQIDEF